MYALLIERLTDTQLLVLFPIVSCLILGLVTLVLQAVNRKFQCLQYDTDIIDTATQNTMSGGYVVLGFVLALVMTTASGMDDKVSQEAQAIKSLNRLLILDQTAPALKAREALIAYTGSILTDEWPGLRFGHGSERTSAALTNVFREIDRIDPQSPKTNTVFGRILVAADQVAQARNDRLMNISNTLPTMFYTVSVISIAGVIIICALRLMEASLMRVVTLTVQLIMLTLMLGAIAIVDLPYLGDTNISDDNISAVYDGMRSQDPILHSTGKQL